MCAEGEKGGSFGSFNSRVSLPSTQPLNPRPPGAGATAAAAGAGAGAMAAAVGAGAACWRTARGRSCEGRIEREGRCVGRQSLPSNTPYPTLLLPHNQAARAYHTPPALERRRNQRPQGEEASVFRGRAGRRIRPPSFSSHTWLTPLCITPHCLLKLLNRDSYVTEKQKTFACELNVVSEQQTPRAFNHHALSRRDNASCLDSGRPTVDINAHDFGDDASQLRWW